MAYTEWSSLDERFEYIISRYVPIGRFSTEEAEARKQAAKSIENDIFANTKIVPEDINDESTTPIQAGLLDREI